jgi:hypothetical protein
MNISKPKYYITEITEQFENKSDVTAIESKVIGCILDILNDSSKFLFSDNYSYYIDEFEDDGSSSDLFSSNGDNLSFEYFDSLLKRDVLINIIDDEHPLYEKLFLLLGKKMSKKEKNKLILYFYKNQNDEWCMPVETVVVSENLSKNNLQLFPNKAFNMSNNLRGQSQKDSFSTFIDGLLDIFKGLLTIMSNKKMEFVLVPPKKSKSKSKAKRKLYYYKVCHIFFRKPESNLKNNQALSVKIRHKNRDFDKNIKNIKEKLFFN